MTTKQLEKSSPPDPKKLTKLKIAPPSNLDKNRWLYIRTGMSKEELANRQGVSLQAIEDSVARYQAYQQTYSNEMIVTEVNKRFVEALPKINKVLDSAMEAERYYQDGDGNPVFEPNHNLRLEAVDRHTRLIEIIQPKANGVQVNVNQTNNNLNLPKSGKSFEQRLRELREQRGLKNQPPIADAEVIDDAEIEDEEDDDEEIDDANDGDDGDVDSLST